MQSRPGIDMQVGHKRLIGLVGRNSGILPFNLGIAFVFVLFCVGIGQHFTSVLESGVQFADETIPGGNADCCMEAITRIGSGCGEAGFRTLSCHVQQDQDASAKVFDVDGNSMFGIEQNPKTKSKWAAMARSGKAVMQFIQDGRYVAVVADGKAAMYGKPRAN